MENMTLHLRIYRSTMTMTIHHNQVSMSKFVLQTFHVTDAFLQGVRQKASMYPEDITLSKVNALPWDAGIL